MYNKITLVGNLTRDIELRYTASGTAIASTAIATSRKFTSNGEKKEEVCFVDITAFGRTGEVMNQYLKKGSKILVEGRLNFDQWTDQNGQKRSKHSVVVESMQMMDSKSANDTNVATNQAPQQNDNPPSYQHQEHGQPQQNNANTPPPSYQAPQQQMEIVHEEIPKENPSQQSIDFDENAIPF